MQPVTLTRPSSTSLPRDLHNDIMCTTRHRISAGLEVKLKTPSASCFLVK
jgi:hypothetical protein